MGGFSFVLKTGNAGADVLIGRSRMQFTRTGFGAPVSVETEAFVFDYYGKIGYDACNLVQFATGDFIASVGTFIYRGNIDRAALEALYREPDPDDAIKQARGHFAIVLYRNGVMTLLRDLNRSYEVFYDASLTMVSSAFLPIAKAFLKPEMNVQEVYEYVFQSVSFGANTPLANVRRLDFDEAMTLLPRPAITHHLPEADLSPDPAPRDAQVAEQVRHLTDYFKELASFSGDRIVMGLSGGYDTRLLLALFRRIGVQPRLVVYGNGQTQDVAAATRIAEAEKLKLHHIDKSRLNAARSDDLAEAARENFEREDGLPLPGILEPDAERFARHAVGAGKAFHVHGGGGEIFRNFFNTPDRPRSCRKFIWSFFNAFDPRICTKSFSTRRYEAALAGKIAALLRLKDDRLTRQQVEYLYPHFRCRSWFGRENSLNSRYFHSVLPFYDHQTIKRALRIPVRHKYFGDFESRMIRLADPGLARHRSNYGHGFDHDAPVQVAVSDFLTYWRPAILRRYIYRLRTRLSKRNALACADSTPFLGGLVDPRFPFMSRFFVIARVKDELQFSRICTLEYLCQSLRDAAATADAMPPVKAPSERVHA